jgi:hypothetical protein
MATDSPALTQTELQYMIFDYLHEQLTMPDPPRGFVGVQGDNIVILQSSGEHFGVRVVPATASGGA